MNKQELIADLKTSIKHCSVYKSEEKKEEQSNFWRGKIEAYEQTIEKLESLTTATKQMLVEAIEKKRERIENELDPDLSILKLDLLDEVLELVNGILP